MKYSSIRKPLAACLAGLMLLSAAAAFSSCARNDEEDSTTANGSGTGESATETETETHYLYDDVEKEKYNRDFNILSFEETEFISEKQTGEVLNDAIYLRNTQINEDYGVKINTEVRTAEANLIMLKRQVQGGLNDFDLYISNKFAFNGAAANNYLYDMNQISTMDLSAPCWDHACYDSVTVDGKTYLMIGDVNTQSLGISCCMCFNKRLLKENQYSEDDLFNSVEDSTWTLDKLIAMSENINQDLNGDGSISGRDDQYCLVSWMMGGPYSFFFSAGGRFVGSDGEGHPVVNYDAEKTVALFEKLYKLLVESGCHLGRDLVEYEDNFDIFVEGRALFFDLSVGEIGNIIVESKDPYGILPMPKFDSSQETYLSFVNGATTCLMIPKNEKDTEYVGHILQAMNAYNYDKVTPLMYEVVTKLQAAQDPKSASMVDYIVHNRVHDLAYWLDMPIVNTIKDHIVNRQPNITSSLKSTSKQLEKYMERVVSKFEKCD